MLGETVAVYLRKRCIHLPHKNINYKKGVTKKKKKYHTGKELHRPTKTSRNSMASAGRFITT